MPPLRSGFLVRYARSEIRPSTHFSDSICFAGITVLAVGPVVTALFLSNTHQLPRRISQRADIDAYIKRHSGTVIVGRGALTA